METQTEMSVAEVLDAAADKIERDGWCQRDYGRDTGPSCMGGAIYKVTEWDWKLADPPRSALNLSLRLDGLPYTLEANDEVFTSADQAIDALRRAARRARGETVEPLPR